MYKKLITGGVLAGLIAAGAVAGTVSAQAVADATGLTEEQAIEIALVEVPGEVLEVELERDDGARIFEIEILTAEDEEMYVEIDAETGEVLEIEADDDGHDCDDDD